MRAYNPDDPYVMRDDPLRHCLALVQAVQEGVDSEPVPILDRHDDLYLAKRWGGKSRRQLAHCA